MKTMTNMSLSDATTTTMIPLKDNATVVPTETPEQVLAISIILSIISVFGTFGNGLVLYVFTRKSDKVTSTIFILALAWTDLFTCMVIVPYTVVSIQTGTRLVYDVACKVYQFLITCNVPLSAFIMVAIAVDRYFSICHPFLHAVTPRRARISILCLCLFAFTLGTITACMHGVYTNSITTETVREGEASWCPNTTIVPAINTINPWVQNQDTELYTAQPKFLNLNHSTEIIIKDGSFSPNSSGSSNFANPATIECSRNVSTLVYLDGYCRIDLRLFSLAAVELYANITASFYAISLLVVFTLYFFIYRSVVRRRAWRRKQKSWSHSPMTATAAPPKHDSNNGSKSTKTASTDTNQHENMELFQKGQNGKNSEEAEDMDGRENGKDSNTTHLKQVTVENGVQPTCKVLSSAEKKASRERRDFNFLANIRTAGMLFVVAVVFIFSFLPSWLMACRLIDYNVVVFYMYFIYNSANPVIYAFMNQSFRKELKRVFQRGTHFLRSG